MLVGNGVHPLGALVWVPVLGVHMGDSRKTLVCTVFVTKITHWGGVQHTGDLRKVPETSAAVKSFAELDERVSKVYGSL